MPTVLVASCHRYRDAWAPMAETLRRRWPDCPWRRVLVTNVRDMHDPALDPFRDRFTLGSDLGWCANLATAVRSGLYEPPYLLLQEDFFLTRDVDTPVLVEAAALMARYPDVGCLRLYPCPGPAREVDVARVLDVPLGEVHRGEPYRISCQAALWQRDLFLAALDAGTDAGGAATWFELAGDPATRARPERVLSVLRSAPRWPIEYLVTAIVRARWSQDAVKLIRGMGMDPGSRAVEEA